MYTNQYHTQDLSNLSFLITGGAGFIGSQLGYHLHKKGYDVILLDNMSYGNSDNLEIQGKTFGKFISRRKFRRCIT